MGPDARDGAGVMDRSAAVGSRAPGTGVMDPDITRLSPGKTQADGKRERGVVSDIRASSSGKTPMDGERERAPVKGAMDSEIPTQFSDMARGGVRQDALGAGKKETRAGARERGGGVGKSLQAIGNQFGR